MNVYDFTVKTRKNEDVSLADYKGKVLLIVNTATACGFTPQYKELQASTMSWRIRDLSCSGKDISRPARHQPRGSIGGWHEKQRKELYGCRALWLYQAWKPALLSFTIYQSNLCHNHSACFHTYSVLNKINLSKPVIAFFVRLFEKKEKRSWNLVPLEVRLVYCPQKHSF